MAENLGVNNRRIAKNTLFLYFRMLLLMIISLYTSRVILRELGVEDYGIYNVVGGVLALFTFINGSLYSATSRFLTYELGKGDIAIMKKTFSNALALHLGLALIVIILGETVGLYIVNHVLIIPQERLFACNILYQTVIISTFFNLAQVPNGALIISYERMSFYAYIGIFDAVSKCVTAILIQYIDYDKLISLSLLNLIISVIVIIAQAIYCRQNFPEVFTISPHIDKTMSKKMLGFSFWSLIGAAAYMLRIQGVNIILNLFFGSVVNAANAIAYQVNNAVGGFVSNFSTAVNPQIIKSYASGEDSTLKKLLFRSGKFTFFLLMFLSFPLILETNFILHLWLGKDIPEYTIIMTRLVLIISMVESYTYSIGCAINATGNVKTYQTTISGIMLLIFPLSFILFQYGLPPYTALLVYLVTSILALVTRLYFIHKQLLISPSEYIKRVFLKTIPIAIGCILVPLLIINYMSESWPRFFATLIFSESINCLAIWIFGLDSSEKTFITQAIINIKYKFNIR